MIVQSGDPHTCQSMFSFVLSADRSDLPPSLTDAAQVSRCRRAVRPLCGRLAHGPQPLESRREARTSHERLGVDGCSGYGAGGRWFESMYAPEPGLAGNPRFVALWVYSSQLTSPRA